jgi:acetyltransferase-like isoleucine patch superfamily enzyme
MFPPSGHPRPPTSVRQRLQRLIQTRLWGMDIAPSAWIAGSALIDRTWPRGIHIGANCIIDEEAVILTHDLTRGLYLDTWIAADAYIGARAIVLPGVSVGRGCVVEPGSLVASTLADGARVSGNPATVVSASSEA